MMMQGQIIAGMPLDAILAHSIFMSSEDNKSSIKKAWGPGGPKGTLPVLFEPHEMDIYCNKITREVFIFHGKTIDYEALDYLEYNPKDYSVDVVMKDGSRLDLGVKIQWLVRPYFTKAPEIMIVQTKDGESINGTNVPLKHKEKK